MSDDHCKTCGGTQDKPLDVAINFGIWSPGRPEVGLCPDPFHGVPFEAAA